MSQPLFDPSSKWMLEEQGVGILYLAGARSVVSCRARKAEVVQPRKLPDGLLEVRFAGQAGPGLVLVEVATYPEKRVVEQIQDDIRLVRQARGVLPEALVLCLCPRGSYRVPEQGAERSPQGWTAATLKWKVVELWTLSAEELLAAPNVGVVPWVPLARYDGPAEVLLQRCRDRLDREGGAQQANLLAVTQVFARLHFDKPEWLEILGGRKAMIESPLIQEIVEESERAGRIKATVEFLEARFGAVTPTVTAGLQQVKEEEKLARLTRHAAVCPSLQAFEDALRQELPAPAPTSTRGQRRSRKPSP
jgi:predicted transposase YdaD